MYGKVNVIGLTEPVYKKDKTPSKSHIRMNPIIFQGNCHIQNLLFEIPSRCLWQGQKKHKFEVFNK